VSIFPTKILLATDGSREAELATRTAADLANKTTSELHVVNVAGGRAYYTESREVTEQLRQRAGQLLDEQVGKIKEAGGTVAETHIKVVAEHFDRAIVDLAEELGAGLIVMGSRGQGGVKRALLGSVSDSVVRHAHCPVLVVREEKQL
jgi:nucleotide-binding universal stress UspA family protein